MDFFNNTAGDLLFSTAVHAGGWYALGCTALGLLLSLAGRQAGRRHDNR